MLLRPRLLLHVLLFCFFASASATLRAKARVLAPTVLDAAADDVGAGGGEADSLLGDASVSTAKADAVPAEAEVEPLRVDVAVVGGGIGGLYTAWRLSTASPAHNAHVFEASSRIGGRTYSQALSDKCPSIVAELGGMRLRVGHDIIALQVAKMLNVKMLPFFMNGNASSSGGVLSDDPRNTMMLRGHRITRSALNAMTVRDVREKLGYDVSSPHCKDTDGAFNCTDIIANTLLGPSGPAHPSPANKATHAGVLNSHHKLAAGPVPVLANLCAGRSNADITYEAPLAHVQRYRWSMATMATHLGFKRDALLFLDDTVGCAFRSSSSSSSSSSSIFATRKIALRQQVRLASRPLPPQMTWRLRRAAHIGREEQMGCILQPCA